MFSLRRAAGILIICFSGATHSAAEPARPNILLIVADDLGYGELGCQGNPQVPTPHIDSIARNGVRFDNGYVSAPYCAPSRAGFLTGRNQARFGYDLNPVGKQNLNPKLGLPVGELTMADYLKRGGYATGLIGKWHLGGGTSFHPQRRGFNEFYGFLHEGHYFAPTTQADVTSFLRSISPPPPGNGSRWSEGKITWSNHAPTNEPAYNQDNPIMRGDAVTEEQQFLTDAWAREAGDFIGRHREAPFFLYLAYNAPHSPMQALDRYMKRFEQIEDLHRRVFSAMVAHLDESVGRVLATLREQGLEEKTLVVLLSDNGGPTRELTSSNLPLSGGKGSLLEGGIRVPFLLQWKGHIPADQVYHEPVVSLDILPTALAAAGLNPDPEIPLDGVDLLPFLTGKQSTSPHAALMWRYGAKSAVRRFNWKLVKVEAQESYRLYDLAKDPGETLDLAANYPALVSEMRSLLEEWLAKLPAPISATENSPPSRTRASLAALDQGQKP